MAAGAASRAADDLLVGPHQLGAYEQVLLVQLEPPREPREQREQAATRTRRRSRVRERVSQSASLSTRVSALRDDGDIFSDLTTIVHP